MMNDLTIKLFFQISFWTADKLYIRLIFVSCYAYERELKYNI